MTTLLIVSGVIAALGMPSAQAAPLTGTWNIVEFAMTRNGDTSTTTESQLREAGSVWALLFLEEGKLKQASNMRTGILLTGETEVQEGSWTLADDALTLTFEMDQGPLPIRYTYEVKDDVLVLKRSSPNGAMMIVATFKKS